MCAAWYLSLKKRINHLALVYPHDFCKRPPKKINQSNNYRQITVAKIVIKHLSNILIKDLLGKSKESIKESHAHLFFLHITRQA